MPFVLLLLDYWAIGRARSVKSLNNADSLQMPIVFRLVLEKVPFFLLAAASSVVTFLVQQGKGAVGSFDVYPFGVRLANAVVSYIAYIGKMIWPHNLAFLYPHQGMPPIWQIVVCVLIIVCISFIVIRTARKYPYFAVGWLWYIGTLVPVIGLVQVGEQAMADRYTYVPFIGLFIIMAWGVPDVIKRWRYGRVVLGMLTFFILPACLLGTWVQVGYWKNSYSLFKHAADVTVNNCLAHNNLGVILVTQGRHDEAIKHFSEAILIRPDDADAYINLGAAMEKTGERGKAVEQYKEALKIEPDNTIAHNNLANVLAEQGRVGEAFKHYFAALDLDPDDSIIYYDIAGLYAKLNRKEESINWLVKAAKKGFRDWGRIESDKRFDNIRQSAEFKALGSFPD
ncbi:MAG: tetratricopeptide repeat protein [Desulfobacterales bacterium]|nr:tetratricopeptide repeat protein [Desulfobacterales bacterium]